MENNKINQALHKRKFISNRAIQRLDNSMITAGFFTMIGAYASELPITHNIFLCVFLVWTILVLFFLKIFNIITRSSQQFEEKVYEYNINELILAMYRNGLVLSDLSNNLYIFKTKNKLLPNDHFVVKDYSKYCSIFGQTMGLSLLSNSLRLSEKMNPNRENYN